MNNSPPGSIVLIAHRGNIFGPNKDLENKPQYVTEALNFGYDVEIDLWFNPVSNELSLGHDEPTYACSKAFISQKKVWIHCKNISALEYCKKHDIENPYFWHQEDDVTLTSNGLFWTYPGKPLTPHSIAVMPETAPFKSIGICQAICSDYVAHGLDFFYDLCTIGEGSFAFQQIQKRRNPSS